MQPLDLDRYLGLARASACAPSPCGRYAVIAAQRLDDDGATFISELWRVSLVDDGPAVRLTYGDHQDSAPAFRRDGALCFLSDRKLAGDSSEEKRKQIWCLPASGGEARPLTDEPLGVRAFRFAERAPVLIYSAAILPGVPHEEQRETAAERAKKGPSALRYTRQPVRFWDHWVPDDRVHFIACGEDGSGRRDLTPDADRYALRMSDWDVTPDGATVIATEQRVDPSDRIDSSHLLLIEVESGALRRVGAELPRTQLRQVLCAPDGRTVALTWNTRSDSACGRVELRLLDLENGTFSPLAADWDRWPQPACWSEDGQTLYVRADERGDTPIFAIERATGAVSRLTGEGSWSTLSRAPGGEAMVGLKARLTHPWEAFALSPEGDARALATISGFTEEDAADLARISRHHTLAEDGVEVHYMLVRPRESAGPTPAVLWIHGGPISAWGDTWHWRWNALTLASRGYTVVLPNPRGSTGFGQDFIEGIWGGDWGGACYDDLMRVVDAVSERDDVDAGRFAAMGGSFGGYMTNWIGVQSERFKALITHASLYDLKAFHGSTDFPAFFNLELGGDVFTDPERFTRHSPARYVERWRTPTLIIHGERDYRVPIGEALALFESLQAHGVESELLVFPDENHWILKPRNIEVWYQAVIDFLDARLG